MATPFSVLSFIYINHCNDSLSIATIHWKQITPRNPSSFHPYLTLCSRQHYEHTSLLKHKTDVWSPLCQFLFLLIYLWAILYTFSFLTIYCGAVNWKIWSPLSTTVIYLNFYRGRAVCSFFHQNTINTPILSVYFLYIIWTFYCIYIQTLSPSVEKLAPDPDQRKGGL